MGEEIYMYGRTASLSVESMNHANKAVRARTVVDVLNAAIILFQLESKRCKQHTESAWNWTQQLTTHEQPLREGTFAKVGDYCLYTITITDAPGPWNCRVVRANIN